MQFDHSLYVPGMEAIDFQVNNNFAKELTAIFQEVFDYKEKIDYSKVPNVADELDKHTSRMINSFCQSTMKPKFLKCVENNTGIKVETLTINGGPDQGVDANFAVWLDFGDADIASALIENISGRAQTSYTNNKEAVDDMRRMHEKMDIKKGRVTSFKYGRQGRKFTSAGMFFDANAAFCPECFMAKKYLEGNFFTAQELAAIMLHEVGHVLTIVEHSNDLFVTQNRLQNYAFQLKESGDINKLTELNNSLIDQFKSTTKPYGGAGKDLFHMIAEMIGKMLKMQDSAANRDTDKDADPVEESWLLTIGYSLANLALFKLVCSFLVIMNFNLIALPLILAIQDLTKMGYASETESGTKASDTRQHSGNLCWLERWADEFVSRHGYAEYLASGLAKIQYYIGNGAFMASTGSHRLRQSTIFGSLVWFGNLLIENFSYLNATKDPISYERDFARLKRMVQNEYAAFKDTNMPGPFIDRHIQAIQSIEKSMQATKGWADTPVGKAFTNIIQCLLSPVNLLQAMYNGKLDRDYRLLSDRFDDFKNNQLYYLSAVLKRR